MGFENAEFGANPEPRCPCLLVLDTSGSMGGAPIVELNKGIMEFHRAVSADDLAAKRVEIAIVTFGAGGVQLLQDFVTMEGFTPPRLTEGGVTPMGEALKRALSKLGERKAAYQAAGIDYYRPWVFLITDGSPTDEWQSAAALVRAAEAAKNLSFFAVGVQGADMATLSQIAPPQRPPLALQGLRFGDLFQWLSRSLGKVSQSKVGEQVSLPPVGWAVA
jgi:uncharacterized protein YegL